jgi:hypothetical protein
MAAALFSFLRSLLPRRVGNPLPTMHSLKVRGGQQGCPPYGSLCERRPLRVVQSRGRLVISGRMADVCAELDRLAALESANDEAPPPAGRSYAPAPAGRAYAFAPAR